MDSDESRPGSSASNSSSSSSNSNSASSPRKSRSKSPASRASSSASSRDGFAPKSPMNGVASRSSSPANKSARSASPSHRRSRSVSRESNHSSSDDEATTTEHRRTVRSVSRNQSISPARKSHSKSSRGSSVSSVSSEEHLKTDEISDGEMESDREAKRAGNGSLDENASAKLNMSHEDLSDVSDLDSPGSPRNKNVPAKVTEPEREEEIVEKENEVEEIEDDDDHRKNSMMDLRQKLDERKNQQKSDDNVSSASRGSSPAKVAEKKNDEDALDFEAEEGECQDPVPEEKPAKAEEASVEKTKDSDGEVEEGEELEEGEVSDEDDKRPEENEPKPICRFYTRGQCTWGMSCRFLHPGVTDKGNYTMFDMIRPVPHSIPYGRPEHMERIPPGYHPADFRNDRPAMHLPLPPGLHHPAFAATGSVRMQPAVEPAGESAWERGLRTAKEMMRKAMKRKEQDMDFEDKKMNLSAAQDDLEKDNYYIRDRASPEHGPPVYPIVPRGAHYDSPPHAKYPQRPLLPLIPGAGPPPPFDDDPYGRSARYRELPAHRMPQYEDEILAKQRRSRPTREVILQRAEPVGRGDEWNDPWMRSKSPGREKRRDRRSYSSNSSYSSSSSTSRSDSSSNTSRSPTPGSRRNRYNSGGGHSGAGHNKSPAPYRRKRSPSPPKRRGHSPVQYAVHKPTTPPPQAFEPKHEFRNHIIVSNQRPLANVGHEPNKIKSNPFERKVFDASVTIPGKHSKPTLSARRSPPPSANMMRKRVGSPPPVDKRRGSPINKRKRVSPPPARKPAPPPTDKGRKKRRSSSSGSGSSDSSGSDSGSSYSSSSSSSSRAGAARRGDKKAVGGKKVETKKQDNGKSASTSSNTAGAAASSSASAASKKTTRREELLKQLRAVEDAIARKRQKLP